VERKDIIKSTADLPIIGIVSIVDHLEISLKKMKPNPNKYYLTVENRVYSLTEKQYQKFKNLWEGKGYIDKTQLDEGKVWDDALKYIEKIGRYEFDLFTMFRY
jgi:hypothetical protein